MVKFSISLLVLILINATLSCAPQSSGSNQGRPKDTVTEQAVNNLSANIWCQQNLTTGTTEYRWFFKKDFEVISTNVATQDKEVFKWMINGSNNELTVSLAENAPLFSKLVTYSFNVTLHKRTMRWLETGTDVINFIECE